MRRTGLKTRIADRSLTIGSWLSFSYLPVVEMMAGSGFDWLVIDMEHTSIGISEALEMMIVIENAGVSPLVRVGANDPLLIKRVMDSGAHGIVVPNVNSPEDAERAVQAMYYPPRGSRGAGLGRAQSYGAGFDKYRQWLDGEAVLIVQIEHVQAVRSLDRILAVEGVDAFMVGPYDLSASVGKPGAFEDPEVMAAFAMFDDVMATASKSAGIHIVHSDPEMLRKRIAEGYRFIAYGDDMVFIKSALERELALIQDVRNG